MRKILYATAAVVGASMLAQGALAAVSVSGQYRGAYLFQSGDEDRKVAARDKAFGPNDRESFYNDATRLTFTASKDHPTGLESGFYLQYRAESVGGDPVANAYGYISGAFGRFRAGDYAPAGYGTGYAVATPFTANFGVDDCNYGPSGGGWLAGAGSCGTTMTTAYVAGYRNRQIGYTSPSFSGFQVEVTYSPDAEGGRGASKGVNSVSEPGGTDQAFSVGMAYSNSVGGADVSIGAGFASATYTDQARRLKVRAGDAAVGKAPQTYVRKGPAAILSDGAFATAADAAQKAIADADNPDVPHASDPYDDPSAFNLGIVVGIDSLSFGGSYGKQDRTDGGELTAFSAGGSYNLDALTFGLGWRQSTSEQLDHYRQYPAGATQEELDKDTLVAGDISDADVMGSTIKRWDYKDLDFSVVAFTVDYEVGDGAAVDFVIEQSTTEGGSSNVDYSDTGFGIGLNLTF